MKYVFKLCAVASAVSTLALFPDPASADWHQWILDKMFPGKNYGVWKCSSCSIPSPSTPNSPTAVPDISAFIKDKNDDIHAGERVARWSPNSYITVCNDSVCMTVYYQADTDLFLPRAPSFKNTYTTFKNSGAITRLTKPGQKYIRIRVNGPVASDSASYSLEFYIPGTVTTVTYPAKTMTVTASPMIVTGVISDFTPGLESSMRNNDLGYYQDGNNGTYGSGSGCVEVNSLLPDGRRAGDIKVGDVMELGDDRTMDDSTGVVTYSERKTARGFRIVTNSGVSLVCSESAPIATKEGLVLAPNLLGKQVGVRIDATNDRDFRWETVSQVAEVGLIDIQHITVGDRCFWAGETSGKFILHHNLKCVDCSASAGDGGASLWNDW